MKSTQIAIGHSVPVIADGGPHSKGLSPAGHRGLGERLPSSATRPLSPTSERASRKMSWKSRISTPMLAARQPNSNSRNRVRASGRYAARFRVRAERAPTGARSLVHLPVLAHEPDRDRVEDQGQHEQRRADGEDRLVLQVAAGTSPLPVLAMKVVIVSADSAWVEPRLGPSPAGDQHDHRLADRPRGAEHDRSDVPDSAAGKTTRSQAGAGCPEAVGASRSPAGTERIASSEIEAIVGRTMNAMMIPAKCVERLDLVRAGPSGSPA